MRAKIDIILLTLLHVITAYEFDLTSIENENSQSISTIANSINQFSTDFYEIISHEKRQKNMVCSTLSVAMVLMMAAYGAGGKTLQEINKVLHMSSEEHIQKNGIHSLINQLNAVKEIELRLANNIFIKSGSEIKLDFQNMINTIFQTRAKNLNFTNSVAASREINNWCEKQTNSRIKNIVQSDDFDDTTALVLINAVYFKGNWAKKFNESDTKLRNFYTSNNDTKKVPMMHDFGKYRYGELPQLSAKFIELPYQSTDIKDAMSMIIILPDKIDGLEMVEENLHKINLTQLLMGNQYEIDLFMPKFKIESKIDLRVPLSKLGMVEIFGNNANFTRMMDEPPLKVTKIIQKAFIEVNEEGSEAAAVTGLQVSTFSLPIQSVFRIDRSFYYFIVKLQVDDRNSGIILFQGRCIDIE